MATRRGVLLGLAASALGPPLPAFAASTVLAGAARMDGKDGGVLWSDGVVQPFPLPARGHGLAAMPDQKVLIVGRRPGEFAAIVDKRNAEAPPAILHPANANRFAGHCALSADATLLVTSEFETGSFRGALVAREPKDGAIRAVWDPQGIEPHDLVFANGNLVAALGGLIKDGGVAGPAYNPGGIDSALLEIDPATGHVMTRHKLAAQYASLSLRHLALTKDVVVVGMQDQDLSEPQRPLVGVLHPGDGIDLLPLPARADCDFRGYVGSVAADRGGLFAAAASPRGSVLGFWSLIDWRWIGGLAVPDVCGLTQGAADGEFWASSGLGEVLQIIVDPAGPRIAGRWHVSAGFDNHLLRV